MKRTGSRLFVLVLLSVSTSIASVTGNLNLNSSGQAGLVDCHSANSLGFTKLVVAVTGKFAFDPDLIPRIERYGLFFDTVTSKPYTVLYTLYPAIAFGVTDFLDFSLVQPVYVDILEDFLPEGGFGDLKLSLKCRVPGSKPRFVDGAILTELTFANGHRSNGFYPHEGFYLPKSWDGQTAVPAGSVSMFTARKPTWAWSLLGTLGKKRFYFHLNLGVRLVFDDALENTVQSGAGFEFQPIDWITLFTDIYASPRMSKISDGFNITDDPFHISPGVTFRAPGGAILSFGGTWKLSSNREFLYRHAIGEVTEMAVAVRPEPTWQLFVQLGWNGFLVGRDKDNDQLRDKDDQCPDAAEDLDDFQDQDGCPDFDNDKDGIPDTSDSCMNIPEDIDGFMDTDGCPDDDNDGDLIADSIDQCSDVPEDRDGFSDDDGCPDPDNDNDGVADSVDKCMGIPEDRDSFEDDDGCPDLDNDKDAIPDSVDNCPDSAGIAELQGCPKVREKSKVIRFGRLILSGVSFAPGTAELTPGSVADLDRVYQSLTDWPEVTIEIRAFTDNSISPDVSRDISQRRADIVREYLVNKGILPSRVSAIGKGSSEPIADNRSAQGRQLNNRVELHRNDHNE